MYLRMMRSQSCTVTFGKTCNTMPFAKPQKRHIDHLKFAKKKQRENGMMMAVIHTLISLVVCTSNAYASKCNDDNGHSYIV